MNVQGGLLGVHNSSRSMYEGLTFARRARQVIKLWQYESDIYITIILSVT